MSVRQQIDHALAVAERSRIHNVWLGYGDWNQFCAEIGVDPEDAIVTYRGLTVSMSDTDVSGVRLAPATGL